MRAWERRWAEMAESVDWWTLKMIGLRLANAKTDGRVVLYSSGLANALLSVNKELAAAFDEYLDAISWQGKEKEQDLLYFVHAATHRRQDAIARP
jgi:hypothetical protein